MTGEQEVRGRPNAPHGEQCQDCGGRYDLVYWLPDDLWALVTPKPENRAAGLLCPDCADRRARDRGVFLRWTAEVLT